MYAARDASFLRTTDGGHTWQATTLDRQYVPVRELFVDPVDPTIVYMAPAPMFTLLPTSTLLKSRDGGRSWNELPLLYDQSTPRFALTPARPGTLFFVDRSHKIVRTSDDGMTTTEVPLSTAANGLLFDGKQPDLLYVSSAVGLIKKAVP
jgi:photosystem II stability/assembly factor-like uncharacterized protein